MHKLLKLVSFFLSLTLILACAGPARADCAGGNAAADLAADGTIRKTGTDAESTDNETLEEESRDEEVSKDIDAASLCGPAIPYAWDTKFKEGVSTQNPTGYDILYKLYDDDEKTAFWYVLYNSDSRNGLPDFTAYFDNAGVSGIRIRNGHRTDYYGYMRVHTLNARIYTYDGEYEETELTLPDADTGSEYYCLDFSRLYTGVTMIEIYITDRYLGIGRNRFVVFIRDIGFY